MKVNFNKWWLLPSGILVFSALVALGIVAFKPAFIDHSYVQVAQRVGSEPALTGEAARDCSGDLASDYSCQQEHYQGLVRGSGVDTAFTDLKDEYEKNKFVTDNCHQITHVIGRAAVGLYGDLSSTYGHGDNFCWSGYYHGAMEAIVAKIGPDKVVEEANTICADLGEHQKYSFYHYNCVHGLGHGFMAIMDDELFKSLETCDTLTDSWESESCYGGVFMENVMAKNNPEHPSKYLKDDQPMYPCTDVETKYKSQCYTMQTSYALQVEGTFNKVFDLCSAVEDDYRTTCYQSLGRDASSQSNSDAAKTSDVCMLGQDYDARSNCVIGAVKDFISYYNSDEQAKELCGSLDADLRDVCLDTGEKFYKTVQA